MANNDGDILEVAVVHDNSTSGEQSNVFQLQLATTAPLSDASVLDDIAEWVDIIYMAIRSFINLRNAIREVVVRNKTQGTIVGSTLPITYAGGTGADPAAPQGAALFVYFKTNIPNVILRKFFPSPSTAALAPGGGPNGTALANLAAVADDLLQQQVINGHGYQYGYLSPKTLTFVIPNIGVVPIVCAYQRRRKPGVGA